MLLNVNPDFDSLDEETELFASLGVSASRCLGPNTSAGCPLLVGRACKTVDAATTILFQLDLDTPNHRLLLRAYRDNPDRRIVAVVSPEERDRWAGELGGLELIVGPPRVSDLRGVAASTG